MWFIRFMCFRSPISTSQLQNSRILAVVRAQRPMLLRDQQAALCLFSMAGCGKANTASMTNSLASLAPSQESI